MDIELDYDDLKPGVSEDEKRMGVGRILQLGAGILLVVAGIAMLVLPGQGVITILVGLNLIKPDNALVRWMRRKIPGIPEDGEVPKSYLIVGGLFFAATTLASLFYGDDVFTWIKGLLGF